MQDTIALLWLRRDLRLHDHAALAAGCALQQPLQPVFIFDTDILARFTHKQDRRLTFIVHTLHQMQQKLTGQGGGLVIAHGGAEELIPRIAQTLQAKHLVAARDHEPATRARDRAVFDSLKSQGCTMHAVDDHFLIYAGSDILKNQSGGFFKVYTPFARHWRKVLPQDALMERKVPEKLPLADYPHVIQALTQAHIPLIDASLSPADMLARIGYEEADLGEWQPQEAGARLKKFAAGKLKDYTNTRNMLADDEGTSHLSPYLRFGLISVREVARVAVEVERGLEGTWLNELIWRDFYAMVLYHLPEFPQQEFYEKFRTLPWSRDEALFQRWCEGMTGYPVVDAAMRQLNTTGWMHNRARMIVASFLTKHLLIDWRWGEEYFAQHLMDYELSSNVGGWQWAASTGIDPQPYFRIFNPTSQGQKFDPEGVYIRRYVPELRTANPKHLHEPWKGLRPQWYPAPIVNHEEARKLALEVYKGV